MVDVCVTVRVEGQEHVFTTLQDGRTIVEAADAAGVDLPTQCRAGICATCRARLIEGEVRMIDNMVLDDAELAAGFVLACQSVPLSATVTLEYQAS